MKKNGIFKMDPFRILFITILTLFCSLGFAYNMSQKVTPVKISHAGWTLTADATEGIIDLSHNDLGLVLQQIRLNLQTGQNLKVSEGWLIEEIVDNLLVINTIRPKTTWVFRLDVNMVTISCTSAAGVLTAEAPASADRVVARLLDPAGVPVSWVGTDEAVHSFGGKETRNPSFLPARNPEIMTFALGQVSGSNLHSLFDRNTDIAIIFNDQTRMDRKDQNQDLLNITMPVPGNTSLRIIPGYYTKTLGLPYYSRFDDSVFPSAPVLWCSWTAYYNEAREADIVRNTDWLAANLKAYGFQYIQIDDGYDNDTEGRMHNWITHWDKRGYYPHGPEWLAAYIKSKGLRPGLWLVPNAYAGAVDTHPDWYLRDTSGNFILDYRTPALDATHPGVQEWLRTLFSTLKGWGFEYYKFDGESALPLYAPAVDKSRLYDPAIDPIVTYRNRLKLIRDVVGPETFIEGCQAGTPLNGVGFFNSSFTGHDVYNSWQGSYALFSSIGANAFLNHMVIYVMPGEGIDVSPHMTVEQARQNMVPRCIEVAKTREDPLVGFGVTLPEARTLVTHVSLTGVVYPLASIMTDVPEERARLLKMTMPTMPILPVDLYSRGSDMTWDKFKHTTPDAYIHNFPEILDLKVNARSGIYDVAGFTNWRSESVSRNISLPDKLGLKANVPYVVFDFWQQKLLGVFTDQIRVDIEPHDTRVLLIHPLQNHPQLLGISRHITGAYSVLEQGWDNTKSQLAGLSETVPGDTYSLFVYVPDGMNLLLTRATGDANRDIPVQAERDGNLVRVSFPGQCEKVKWTIGFSSDSR
jgi:hypothetical protein